MRSRTGRIFDEYFKLHLKRSSISSRTLMWLYPDRKGCSACIGNGIGVVAIGKKGVFSSLSRRGLVCCEPNHIGGVCCSGVSVKRNSKVYFLSQKGRWVSICQYLDLSFLGLCVLADAYALHTKFAKMDLPCFYVFPRFADLFDGLYSRETLRHAFEQVKMHKLAHRYNKKSFRIYPDVLDSLGFYHFDLLTLQAWMFENLLE